MLRSLFRNVAISAGAFFAVSVVGLLLVPVLIGAYGIAGFGMVALARLFLPTAALGILDFGFGETATQAVARARSDGDWARGLRLLRLSAMAAACTGTAAAIALLSVSPWMPGWLRVAPDDWSAMQQVLRVTAILLPLQFLSLAVEGAVKGFERFGALRTLEVVTALTYAALVLACVHTGRSVFAVCYALMAALLLRSLVGIALAVSAIRAHRTSVGRLAQDERTWFITTSSNMAVNKVLGASQTQLAPLLIGLLFGPVGAGTYDALSRLPRAIKSVLGLLSSTVLPVAARLETATDARGMRRLGQAGILVVGILALPPVAAAMVFSKPLLDLWIGSTLASFWGWQSLMFLIPGLTVLLSFGGTALLVRPHVTATMNRWTAAQVALQFLLAGMAVTWLHERAFILGQVLAVSITFGPQLSLVCTELGVRLPVLKRLLHVVLALFALSGVAWWTVPFIESWGTLGFGMSLLTLLGWATGLRLGLIPAQRERLRAEMRRRFGSRRGG